MGKLAVTALATAMALFAARAPAQDASKPDASRYPDRFVRLVSPFSPGGGTDILGRFIAQKFSDRWRNQMVVENRAGAGGNVGAASVAKADPDGYTLLVAVNSYTINPNIYRRVPFDIEKDFAPVGMVATSPFVLAVSSKLPVKTVPELIAYATAHPGQLTYGSAGVGTAPHLAGELFNLMAGTDIRHVPYQGSGPNVTGLVRGDVQLSPVSLNSIEGFITSGEVRVIAAMGAKRHPGLPDLPTVAEAALPGYEVDLWYALLAPTGTPKAIVDKVNADLKSLLDAEDTKAGLPPRGYLPAYSTPEALAETIRADLARWKDVASKVKIKID